MFFIPDIGSKESNYDITNFTADNVLCVFRSIVEKNLFHNCRLVLITYNTNNNAQTFLKSINYNVKLLVHYKVSRSLLDFLQYYYFFASSRFIISTSPLVQFDYKLSSQIHIALNYYSPFKNDMYLKLNKNSINFAITTSKIASLIDSQVSSLSIEKYIPIGFPRNDYILKARFSRNEMLDFLNIDRSSKIIIYSPTHRNRNNNNTIADEIVVGVTSYEILENLLKDNNAYLIIKYHSLNIVKKIKKEVNFERILFFQPNYNFTIYDLLAHTNVMITDYTSMYFDFLLTGKPVIFNFSDKEIYEKDRGFSYDPIEIVCAGEIANNEQELMNAIQKSLHNEANISIDKYMTIRKLTNKYCDYESTKRVIDFLVTISEDN